MALLGTILLVFIVTHMQNFWYQMHFGGVKTVDGLKDLHSVVLAFFNPSINSMASVATALYVAAMAAMAFHLNHGFQSAFQSLGLTHGKYTPIIKKIGAAFSIIVPAAFAALPVLLISYHRHKMLDSRIPEGPLVNKWRSHKSNIRLVAPYATKD